MAELSKKVQRALEAMHEDGWTELQHRRVAKRLDEALDRPRRSTRQWTLGLALAACVLLVVAAVQLRKKSAVAPIATVTPVGQEMAPIAATTGSELGDQAKETNAVLSDGSAIQVTRGGRLQVVRDRAEETRLELVAGRAEFEVQKRPERPFITSIRGVEVRVVGTHFTTELDTSRTPSVVRVLVQRGIVEVRSPGSGSVTRLGAGESVEVPVEPAPAAAQETAHPAPTPPPPVASQLFEAARTARGNGDVEGAIRSYAALIKQYPNDERAGVAALELGRLRMDSQHAFGPAADAFRRAIAAAPNEGVREDAMARLVEALDALRDHDACNKERQRYLARYPKGVHAAAVESRCVR